MSREQFRPPGEQCSNCQYWGDFPEVELEEPTGYCGHPDHMTNENREYGGHWAWSTGWCHRWEPRRRPDVLVADMPWEVAVTAAVMLVVFGFVALIEWWR